MQHHYCADVVALLSPAVEKVLLDVASRVVIFRWGYRTRDRKTIRVTQN